MPETALIVAVPESEPFVERLRVQFDSSARVGVPAHVTVLYPFMAPERIDDSVLEQIRDVVRATSPFTFRLSRVGRFPTVVFLAPEPATPFSSLTGALHRRFPGFPPYGGIHDVVIPHLTVSDSPDADADALETELRSALPRPDGIACACRQLELIGNASGRWQTLLTLPLGAAPPSDASGES
jgi:2'-5' RNA ligase